MQNKGYFSLILSDLKFLALALDPFAKRNKISAEAAVLLFAINEGIDLSEFFKADFFAELQNCNFIEKNGNCITITGKGAIFAKSLSLAVEKFENEKYKF